MTRIPNSDRQLGAGYISRRLALDHSPVRPAGLKLRVLPPRSGSRSSTVKSEPVAESTTTSVGSVIRSRLLSLMLPLRGEPVEGWASRALSCRVNPGVA